MMKKLKPRTQEKMDAAETKALKANEFTTPTFLLNRFDSQTGNKKSDLEFAHHDLKNQIR